uniref:Uncharacterized protein n=1 Tax=Lepeophtheirus salmonis TaxID=72036 RepID=A0A0K2VA09_LEPSM
MAKRVEHLENKLKIEKNNTFEHNKEVESLKASYKRLLVHQEVKESFFHH